MRRDMTADDTTPRRAMKPADRADLVVVGAGILGLAVARESLRRKPGMRVLVLEKENRIAAHQTGRNSGVVHAGIYYAPGSPTARFWTRIGSASSNRTSRADGVSTRRGPESSTTGASRTRWPRTCAAWAGRFERGSRSAQFVRLRRRPPCERATGGSKLDRSSRAAGSTRTGSRG